MRCSLAAGAVWLALGNGAAALAPAAGLQLAPAADQGVDQNSTWWWWTSSAKPQQEGVPRRLTPPQEGTEDETQEAQEDAWEAPPATPAELVGMEAGGFCVDAAIFEGPTQGLEECRSKCKGPCKFYSYWHDSQTHRCKLTMGCRERGNDARYSVSAYRAQPTTDEGGGDGPEQGSF